MCKKLIYMVSFVLVLSLVGDVQAVTITWTDTTDDHDWFTAANWDSGVPTIADRAVICLLPGATIANADAIAREILLGDKSGIVTGALTVDGGTLVTDLSLEMANGYDSTGIVNMNSGTITVGTELTIGHRGPGTLNMNGGTIIVTTDTFLGVEDVSEGYVNLYGGTITTNTFTMGLDGSTSLMDITAGTLIIDGDIVSTIEGYISSGWITAYGGSGTVLYDLTTNPGKTTVTAIPEPATIALLGLGGLALLRRKH